MSGPLTVADVAAGLSEKQQRYLLACGGVPRDACFIAYDAANRAYYEIGSPFRGVNSNLIERVSGGKHALVWQYRLTPLGLAVREHLASKARAQGDAR